MNVQFYIVSVRWRPPKLIILDEQVVISNLASFVCSSTLTQLNNKEKKTNNFISYQIQ